MAARAGEKICPQGFFVVSFGMLGDMEYFENSLGLPHHANMPPKPACGWCNCVKGSKHNDWFDFDGAAE
eukprot:6834845-Pyramimonas_sp.AAC.1